MKIAITALITAVLTTAFWALVAAALYFHFASGPPPFQVTLDYPTHVSNGETFELKVHIRNPSDQNQTMDSIDIYDSLLKGFEVVEVSPPPESRDSMMDFTTFAFDKKLPASAKTLVIFRLKARESGYFGGDVDVCTQSQQFTTLSAGIQVSPP